MWNVILTGQHFRRMKIEREKPWKSKELIEIENESF